MQYLNVLLESLDDENQAYFYGERLVIDYVLLTANGVDCRRRSS